MKKILMLVLLSMTLLGVAFAHTASKIVVTCPVCKEKVMVRQTASMTVMGTYKDFQKKGAIGTYYSDIIISSPKCHFAGSVDDFKKSVDDKIKALVKKNLAAKDPGKALDDATECEYAAKIYEWEKRGNMKIANLYLIGSYLLKKAPADEARRKKFQSQAANYFVKGVKAGEVDKKSESVVYYLIGEMYRRTGNFQDSLIWYDRAAKSKDVPKDFVSLIKEQRALAVKKDDNNKI